MRRSATDVAWTSLLLSLSFPPAYAMQPIRDESVRRQVLAAVFPGDRVSFRSGDHYAEAVPKLGRTVVPDAVARERIYRVIGPPIGEKERCAAEDVATSKQSNIRKLRLVVYQWPGLLDLIAVLQYDFVGVDPPGSCSSIGRVVHLARVSGRWRITEDTTLQSAHHHSLQRVELMDVTGDGTDDLLVESDWGYTGIFGTVLSVYSLQAGRLEQIVAVATRFENYDESMDQILDLTSTLATKGSAFCFVRTEFASGGQPLRPVRVSKPCYPRGTGLESQ